MILHVILPNEFHIQTGVNRKYKLAYQFSSVQSLDRMGHHFRRDPLPVFSAGGPCEQMSTPSCCLPNISPADRASPTLQGALKEGFGEAVVACDMPEPSKFASLVSCQMRFLWSHKEVDLAPHPVVGLVLQVGDTGRVSKCTWFQKPGF